MIVVLTGVYYLMMMPAGYLAGSVYEELFEIEPGKLPIISMLFPPLGAVLSVVILSRILSKEKLNDE